MATVAESLIDLPAFTGWDIARHYGISYSQARTMFLRGVIPARPKIGNLRVAWREDIPAIEREIRRLGLVGPEAGAA